MRVVNTGTGCHAADREKSARAFGPRKFQQVAIEVIKKICVERFEAFGAAGRAAKLLAIELEAMARRCRSGASRQFVH